MHGRQRAEYKAYQRDPKAMAGFAAKAQKWHALSAEIAQRRQQLRAAIMSGQHQHQQHDSDNDQNDIKNKKQQQQQQQQQQQHQQLVESTLAMTEKMLLVNPDPLYLWNFRRELWQYHFQNQNIPDKEQQQQQQQVDDMLTTDLRVTQAALENNPKAYGAWFHRKWLLLQLQQQQLQQQDSAHDNTAAIAKTKDTATTATARVLKNELELTRLFLQRDERNFHCWNYRRFVVSCMLGCSAWSHSGDSNDGSNSSNNNNNKMEWWTAPQVAVHSSSDGGDDDGDDDCNGSSINTTTTKVVNDEIKNAILQTEWDFTTTKIQDNFSNFSAFHYRSKLLPWKMTTITTAAAAAAAAHTVEQLLRHEWELWQNAVFTEPDDQTAWWYARFLLDFGRCNVDKPFPATQVLVDEWRYQTLLQEQIAIIRELADEMPNSKWVCLGLNMLLLESAAQEHREESRALWTRLMELDPDRRGRYQEMLSEY